MADESVILGQLAEEFTGRVRQGQLPDVEEYARRCPEMAERIRALFPTLMFLEGAAGRGNAAPTADPAEAAQGGERAESSVRVVASLAPGEFFGHYLIVREIGRGGMGIVYEAVHLPLDKRVALKILPLLSPQAPAQLERFLREAKTAASLHHTNIVPVFDVGRIAGTPYYAMQYIEGRGLDQSLRDQQAGETRTFEPAGDVARAAGAGPVPDSAGTSPAARYALTSGDSHATDSFRQVAELGIQAAEALAYAHERGIVHRDIKPSNLLLDARGTL